jgi:parvulin-like peptidyl-prolyl isomerase
MKFFRLGRVQPIIMTVALALVVALVGCGDSDAVNAQNSSDNTSEDVAIQVDEEVLTQSQLDERVKARMQQFMQQFGVESMDDLPPKLKMMQSRVKQQVVKQSLRQMILVSHAKQSGITVDDAEVEEKWQSLKERFPSEQQFQQQLERMGKSKEDILPNLRKSVLIDKFIEQEIGEITVSEDEIRQYFEQNKQQFSEKERVHARHILVRSDSQAQQDIQEIEAQIEEGAAFEEMAREYSEGPSAQRGGSLDTFPRGKMDPAFEEVAFNLEPGVVSDPVETRFGYHLIKVESKYDSREADLESNRETIRQTLKQQKRQRQMQKLVQRLREESEIENNVEVSSPGRGLRRAPGGQGQSGGSASPQRGRRGR